MSTSQSPSSSVNNNKVVCVIGSEGFIGSWLVKLLLNKGYTVHGTVREQPGSQKHQHLLKFQGASKNLILFQADLLDAHSISSAIVGCNAVFHVASPVTNTVSDPQKDLVEPAVKGTLHVLQASLKAHVERVVFVSSITAVALTPILPKNKILDESCWSNLDHCAKIQNWYGYSKTKAEMETLTFTRQFPGLNVVSVCPTTVWGPILQTDANASSLELIKIFGSDSVENRQRWLVDVRDLADALILAYENPNAKGRYICHSHQIATQDLVVMLKTLYPNYKYPTKLTEWDNYMRFSTEKLQSLCWKVRSLEETLIDSVESYKKAEEASRESRQTKQDRYSEMRRLKDEERKAQERMLEEEVKAQKAKEEEAAALEFEKWKGEFSVDDEGTLEEEQDKTEDLLTNFVEYIKKHKCVPLEDLAA